MRFVASYLQPVYELIEKQLCNQISQYEKF